jgi:phosphate uptake regulator
MTEKHLSTQFDAELSGISTRVLEMGGVVESQVARAIYSLTNFSSEVASEVLSTEEKVNAMEVDSNGSATKPRGWRAPCSASSTPACRAACACP